MDASQSFPDPADLTDEELAAEFALHVARLDALCHELWRRWREAARRYFGSPFRAASAEGVEPGEGSAVPQAGLAELRRVVEQRREAFYDGFARLKWLAGRPFTLDDVVGKRLRVPPLDPEASHRTRDWATAERRVTRRRLHVWKALDAACRGGEWPFTLRLWRQLAWMAREIVAAVEDRSVPPDEATRRATTAAGWPRAS